MQNRISHLADLTARQIAEYASLPEPFQFYRLMLAGDHLHFGYWPEDRTSLSLEQAQGQLFELLLEQMPESPAKVLDVGCGLGFSAYRLSEKGYEVTAIAPSSELIHYAEAHYGHGTVRFEVAGFLDGDECNFMSVTFDAILFQESLQYLHPLDQVFQTARRLLTSKGKLIVCDEMVYDHKILEYTAVHPHQSVLRKLKEAGFCIVFQEAVGNRVQHTCTEMIQRFDQCRNELIRTIKAPDTADRVAHYKQGWQSQKTWYEANKMGYELITALKDDLILRPYQEGDEDRILGLFHQVFGTARSLSHWHWKFRDNPFGSYKIAVAHSADGSLAANFCGYPVPVFSTVGTDASFLSYQIGDTMTNPAFRGSGFGKKQHSGQNC